MPKISTAVTGAAGEHFVMFRLLSQGYIAALAPKGVEGVDIMICDAVGSHLAAVQVKTAGETVTSKWQLHKKAETLSSPTLFYCFVSPGRLPSDAPSCWIIPSAVVAEHVRLSHAAWLAGEPKRGLTRKDGDKRSMHFTCDPLGKYPPGWMKPYSEAWDLLAAV